LEQLQISLIETMPRRTSHFRDPLVSGQKINSEARLFRPALSAKAKERKQIPTTRSGLVAGRGKTGTTNRCIRPAEEFAAPESGT
jgi:hypothetical protein